MCWDSNLLLVGRVNQKNKRGKSNNMKRSTSGKGILV